VKESRSPDELRASQALLLACGMYSILGMIRYANSSYGPGKSTIAVQYLTSLTRSKSKVLKMAASLITGPTDVVEQSWLKAPEPRADITLIAAHLNVYRMCRNDSISKMIDQTGQGDRA
jgi:hypothetical protein